jgi:hypothetical protein
LAASCYYCGERVDADERHILVLGSIQRAHCSSACLHRTIRNERKARAVRRRRTSLAGLAVLVLAMGAGAAWRRFRAPKPEWISSAPSELPPDEKPTLTGPVYYGPAWPPSDEDWSFTFARTKDSWVYPLPGPNRRLPTDSDRVFRADGSKDWPPTCRQAGACGVELGGELWGEHVYAARDGIIERVQTHSGDDGGGLTVRISHFGGMAFTQYFHLAGTPRHIVRGARVRAGDVIGLLGDTGVKDGRRHLHFALSTKPSSAFAEVYWDPSPLMTGWPLHHPSQGTVAGFAPPERTNRDALRRRRR